MKPSEIVNLDEDWRQKVAGNAIGNWLARKGAFGTKTAVTAQGVNMAKGQAELSKASENVLKSKLMQQLLSGLENSVNAGLVFVPVPVPEGKNIYNHYNFLIEKMIVNEAMSVQDYAKQFVKNLLAKYQMSADQQSQLDLLTDTFQKAYKGPGQPPPQKEIDNLLSFVFAVKSSQTGDDYPEPTGPDTVTTQRGVYEFTPGTGWEQVSRFEYAPGSARPVAKPIPRVPVNDDRNIKQLNKLAASV